MHPVLHRFLHATNSQRAVDRLPLTFCPVGTCFARHGSSNLQTNRLLKSDESERQEDSDFAARIRLSASFPLDCAMGPAVSTA